MSATPEQPTPPRVIFRISPLAILFAVFLAVFAIPFAFGAPWFWLIYLLPVGIVGWIARIRTVADPDTLTVRRMFGSRRVPWAQISSLRLLPSTRSRGTRVSAVLIDGAELPLPAVHIRDLPQLAAVSGGWLSYPAGE